MRVQKKTTKERNSVIFCPRYTCDLSGILPYELENPPAELSPKVNPENFAIADICGEENKERVKALLHNDEDDDFTQLKIWEIKKKLIQSVNQPPIAKKDEKGTLVTDRNNLEKLYIQTYQSRLKPNPTTEELDELKVLKKELFNLNSKLAAKNVTKDWTTAYHEVAFKSCRNNKARDIYGHIYEQFKYGGCDLKVSLLAMMNRVKKSQTYPSMFQPATITSIWKKMKCDKLVN